MKIYPVGAEVFQADRRPEGYDKANSRFSEFCEGAQNLVLPTECIQVFCMTLRTHSNYLAKRQVFSNFFPGLQLNEIQPISIYHQQFFLYLNNTCEIGQTD